MRSRDNILANIDWISILLYLILIFMGWLNIYAAVYDENFNSIFDVSQQYGKQLIWIGSSIILGCIILMIDSKFFTAFSIPIYLVTIALLVFVLLFGREVNGARSWFELGSIRIQPAEFAKFATCLAVANIMSRFGFKISTLKGLLQVGLIIAIAPLLIILQNDTGSATVYSAFIFVLYREGLHGSFLVLLFIGILLFIFTLLYSSSVIMIIIIIGTLIAFYYLRQQLYEVYRAIGIFLGAYGILWFIGWLFDLEWTNYEVLLSSYLTTICVGFIFAVKMRMKKVPLMLFLSLMCVTASISVEYVFTRLPRHQQARINVTLGIVSDPTGVGYNVHQSKIAIGSGGVLGKGFLQGTQTKFNFVPEQSTDFIFCTVGEEWGFIGSSFIVILLTIFIIRIVFLAERQRSSFSRIYGYGVASILFYHLAINIGMTIGLFPVIGIPLPFFSYGGSSLWAFTILVFIFLRLDANRLQVFS